MLTHRTDGCHVSVSPRTARQRFLSHCSGKSRSAFSRDQVRLPGAVPLGVELNNVCICEVCFWCNLKFSTVTSCGQKSSWGISLFRVRHMLIPTMLENMKSFTANSTRCSTNNIFSEFLTTSCRVCLWAVETSNGHSWGCMWDALPRVPKNAL